MKFKDIPSFTQSAPYVIDVPWGYLENQLKQFEECGADGTGSLQIEPDFQRDHVWNVRQKVAYVEYILRGGHAAKEIYFNHPGWQRNWEGDFVLVDGLQRLTSVRDFLANKIPAFGCFYKNYEDNIRMSHGALGAGFKFYINTLQTRKEVLQWYLDLNAGGVVHTDEELSKVANLLRIENESN